MSQESEIEETHSKISIKWKINKFFPLRKEMDYYITSPNFSLSDAEWYLVIYPNGDTEYDSVGWVSVCLYRHSSSKKHRISFAIGIQKLDSSVFRSYSEMCQFEENGSFGYGESKFFKTSELLASKAVLTLDDSLTILLTAQDSIPNLVGMTNVVETGSQTISSENEERTQSGIKNLQQNLEDLFISGRHGDITINVKDQKFHAHKLILVARSSVFSGMFDHDTEEKETGIVNITDCDPYSFKVFLSFLYNGKLDKVSPSNAIELYKIADKYDLQDLKTECVSCMEKELSEANFCDVVLLATMHNESQLLEIATEFFVENAKTIVPTAEWQSLGTNYFTIANELHIKLLNKK